MPHDDPEPEPVLDVDPDDGRHETENQRMDRNWAELLQELRVTQTGTQILTGFLLTIAFQPRFATLTGPQRGIYLGLVLAAVATTALGLTPVNLHRGLFRQHSKAVLVRVAHRLLRTTVAGVAVILVGTVLLIFDVTVGPWAAALAAAGSAVLLAALAVFPVVLRARIRRRAHELTGPSTKGEHPR
ncbi:MAG: DUF6328 family protein [Propionibacteriaceae bacterium]